MLIYICIMALSLGLLLIRTNSKKLKIALCCLSFLILFLPHALRYGIGTDYFYTYVPYYNFISSGERFFSEIGFNFINILVNKTVGDYRGLFFVCSLLSIGIIFKAVCENSENRLVGVLMIFLSQYYFYSMNIIRQAIAIAIIFYAYKYLKNNKIIKYVCACLIASFIHVSALMMIPLGIMARFNFKNVFKIVSVSFFLLFSREISFLMQQTINLVSDYGKYFYSKYADNDVSILLIVSNVVIFAITIFYSSINKDKESRILYNFSYFSIMLLTFSSTIPLITRLVRYLTIFQILLIPKLISSDANKLRGRCIVVSVCISLFVIMVYQILILGGEGVFPYKSIFSL